MKTIVQTENIEGKTIPLREVIPVWFAVSSALLGALLGLLEHGAWLSASRGPGSPDALTNREEIIRGRFLSADRRR